MPIADGYQLLDQPPHEVLSNARAAFTASPPRDIASLVFDSLVDASDPPERHRLRFEHPLISIELDVSSDGGTSRITGKVEPAGPKAATVHFAGHDIELVAKVVGRQFSFGPIGAGLVRLSLQSGDSRICTDWFRL